MEIIKEVERVMSVISAHAHFGWIFVAKVLNFYFYF